MNRLLDSREAESIISGLNIMGSLCGFGQSLDSQISGLGLEAQDQYGSPKIAGKFQEQVSEQ